MPATSSKWTWPVSTARSRAPETAEHPAGRGCLAARDPDEEPDEQESGGETQEQARQERAPGVGRLRVDDDLLVADQLGQAGAVDERRDLGLEQVHLDRLLVAGRVVLRLLDQLALNRLAARGDLQHVVLVQLA